jgi:Mn-dependent DtxR family transcriptional regulator
MTNHNNNGMSESEEMYLITIARLVEQGVEDPVAISPLAEALSILPVSANQMVHKLAEEGWLEYLPSGKQTIRRGAIRRRRRDGG